MSHSCVTFDMPTEMTNDLAVLRVRISVAIERLDLCGGGETGGFSPPL